MSGVIEKHFKVIVYQAHSYTEYQFIISENIQSII